MRLRIYFISFSITCLFGYIQAQNPDPNPNCNTSRYLTNTFASVKVTQGQSYGSNITYAGINKQLFMDVYEPEGDVLDERPLIVLAFSGSFINGNRADLADLCTAYARRGFVAASIDYRLYDGPLLPPPSAATMTDVAIKGMGDMKAAIRFFKEDAATLNLYHIDTNHVFVGGISSGAILADAVAYLDESDKGNVMTNDVVDANGGLQGNSSTNFQYSSKVFGVLSFSGAVLDTTTIDANEPPLFMVHDDSDPTMAYGTGFASAMGFPIIAVEGSSNMAIRANNVGLKNSLITVSNSAEHVSYFKDGAAEWEDSVFNASTRFIYEVICDRQPQSSNTIKPLDFFSVYPNPTKDYVNIDCGPAAIESVQLSAIDGRIIFTKTQIRESTYQLQMEEPAGVYLLVIRAKGIKKHVQIIKN